MQITNSLVKKSKSEGITAYLNNQNVINQIDKAIGISNRQRFITAIISAVSNNKELQRCTNESILLGALLGESLQLSPSQQLGHYYLVPYNLYKENKTVAQFQIGYKGLLQLAIRSGQYKKINVVSLKPRELIKYNPLTEEIDVNLIEDDIEREKLPDVGYYAMFELLNGFRKSLYWSYEKMENHARKYSSFYKRDLQNNTNNSFWSNDFQGMAYKTMLRQLLSKWGILTIDLQNAFESDMATIKEDGTKQYLNEEEQQEAAAKVVEKNEENQTNEPFRAAPSIADILFS